MKLAELQAKFQQAIVTDDRAILDSINPSHRLDRAARFAVYTDAYRLRLAGFLSEDFKVLRNALGDEEFGALAQAYIEATLSHHRNARWYARALPEFMQAAAPWRDRGDWIDIARCERALADAFDAKDTDVLSIDALAATAAEDWPQLTFDFQQGLSLLTLARGTIAAYEAAAAEEPLPARTSGAETVLVWRNPAQQIFYRTLDEAETLALTEARAGKTFGEVCSLLAFRDENDAVAERAASFLARWFADGLVTAVQGN